MIQTASVEQLRRAVRGSVMLPGDPAYEAARPVWNGIIDAALRAVDPSIQH